ncbi:hypothetical protein E8E13_002450 [Curvularia kusanoi]|uniref:Uncharacterized protein n=1 Tax=Curvularia kusanoi TaxID=90978 RepID=A0A9P4T577_CURKU|nr:hypothetical protein E8E13_002450 [Curvularia kusanoi]
MQVTASLPLLLFAFAVANPYYDLPETTTYHIPPSLSSASPEYASAYHAYLEYAKTRKDMPAIVTALDAVTSYASMPYWYKALPTDTKKYLDEFRNEIHELHASVVKEITGDAVRTVNVGVHVSGVIAVLVLVIALAL